MSTRVAITGLGAITPLGNDSESTWAGMKEGRSGVGNIDWWDASTFPVRIAGLVRDFDVAEHVPEPRLRRHLSRPAGFAVAAALQALAQSRVDDVYEPHERGISLGGSVGRTELQDMSDILAARRASTSDGGPLRRWPPSEALSFDQNLPTAVIALLGRFEGPAISISTACTGSAHAIGEAYRRIQDGEARMMLAGGFDSLTTWLDVLGFSLLGALTKEYNDDPTRASRPFDRDRSGFVLGEGAVVCVLEEWESARRRGAPLLGELLGYGSSLNAYRMTDPPPDGGGAVIAMEAALSEAGLRPEDIDYVVAHGTGTPAGDISEVVGIKRVFGEHTPDIAITSPKSMIGHTTCAAAGINLLAALGAMRDSVVSPTINLDNVDPKMEGLNFVPNQAQERPVSAALINAFAFGGTNGALVLKRVEEDGT